MTDMSGCGFEDGAAVDGKAAAACVCSQHFAWTMAAKERLRP